MNESKGKYSLFRYYKAHFVYYVESTLVLSAWFLGILFFTLFLTFKYDVNNNIGVFIFTQLAYGTLASIIFFVVTSHLPILKQRLKCHFLIINTVSLIHNDIFEFFASIDPSESRKSTFNEINTLKKIIEEANGLQPVRLYNKKFVFNNKYELLDHTIKNIENRANRLLLLQNILSEKDLYTLSRLLNSCQILKNITEFSQQENLQFISLFCCEVYLYSRLLKNQISNDHRSIRLLIHYIEQHKSKAGIHKEYNDTFYK